MKKRRSFAGILLRILLLAAVCAAGVYGYRKYMPTRETADLDALYRIEKESDVALFLNYERQEEKGLYADGQTYLPVRWVNENLNERFYWDAGEKLLVYALPEEIVTADPDTKGSSGKPLMRNEEDGLYLSLGLILNYTDVRLQVFDSGSQKRVYVENTRSPYTAALMRRSSAVRIRGGVKSPVVTEAEKGQPVVVLETMEKWSKVMTPDGHMGYLKNRSLTDLHEETPESTFEEPVYRNIQKDEKISMVWHQVTVPAANDKMEELLDATRGVNVIAPTWFSLSDNQGNYESLASRSYVEKAHARGIEVWAVLDNFNSENSKNINTTELLSKTSVRRKLIDSLVRDAEIYGIDGINLDFESLKESAGPHYIQFIRELSVSCRKKELVLSVDNYVPAAYNRFYNRREQGIVADYVIIMGYDEHYAGGEAGSVASVDYVEQGIRGTLELVPKEKVINGVPFYTRLWTVKGDKVSSKAMGIDAAAGWVQENDVPLVWDEDLGQYYGEIATESGVRKCWLEEERSLGLKMDLIREYDLAGVAGWKLGLDSKGVWDVIRFEEE